MAKFNLVSKSFDWTTDGDVITFNVDGSDVPFKVPDTIVKQVKEKALYDLKVFIKDFLGI